MINQHVCPFPPRPVWIRCADGVAGPVDAVGTFYGLPHGTAVDDPRVVVHLLLVGSSKSSAPWGSVVWSEQEADRVRAEIAQAQRDKARAAAIEEKRQKAIATAEAKLAAAKGSR